MTNNKTYTYRKTVRITPAEEKVLRERCAEFNMKEAEYFRFLLSQKPMDYPEIRKLLTELINQVNYIGRNINQIVYNNNSGLYYERDKVQLVAYMRKLNDMVNEAVKKIGNQ